MGSEYFFNTYPEARFGGFTNVDGTIAFYNRIRALIQPESVVLDIGCGRGAFSANEGDSYRTKLRMLRGQVKHVIGIDVDPGASTNPHIDEFHQIGEGPWPVDDGSVDLCISDYVLEHISDPDAFFGECQRVLCEGGLLCIRTSNAWGYAGLASHLIPNRWHARILTRVQERREERDVFPTVFRCNSIGRLRRTLARHGFEACVFGHESEPAYFSFSPILYRLASFGHRFIPGGLRSAIFVFARKKASDSGSPSSGS